MKSWMSPVYGKNRPASRLTIPGRPKNIRNSGASSNDPTTPLIALPETFPMNTPPRMQPIVASILIPAVVPGRVRDGLKKSRRNLSALDLSSGK